MVAPLVARRLPPIALAMILAEWSCPARGRAAGDRSALALLGGCDSDLEPIAHLSCPANDQIPPAAAMFQTLRRRAQFIRDPRGHRRESEAERKGDKGIPLTACLDIVLRRLCLR